MTLLQIIGPQDVANMGNAWAALRDPNTAAQTIYSAMATSTINKILLVFANVIATTIVMKKILDLMSNFVQESDGEIYGKLKFIWKTYKVYFLVLLIGALFPVLLDMLEKILATAASKVYMAVNGSSPWDQLNAEQAKFTVDHSASPTTMGIHTDPGYWADYLNIFWWKPCLVFLNQFAYFMYSMVREFYLILLEIMAPIAFACLLDKEYHSYFFTWLKYLVICFLMLPAFSIANYMATEGTHAVFGIGAYSLLPIICEFLLKVRLLSAAKKYVTNLI